MRKFLLILMVIISNLAAGVAYSNSYKAAVKQYRRGQFKKSITLANKAIKKTSSKTQRAKLYKLNGISYYMLMNRKTSKKSFEIALKYNPRITISKKEVLNPKVITFFNSIKKESKKSRKRPTAKRNNPYKKQTNRTAILLKTPKKGTVLVNGIYAGTTGVPLEVKPGILKVSIQSKGYKAKTIKLKVRKNRTNSYAIKMSKIKPKRKPKAVAKKKKKKYPKISKDDMFAESADTAPVIQGRDLKQELAAEGSPAYGAPAQQPYYQAPPQQYYPPPQPYYPPAPQPQYYPPQSYGYQQAPTPVPAPYSDPNMGSPSIDYYADDPAPPSGAQNYSQNNPRMSTKNTSQRSFSALQLAPLGLNLFFNDQLLAGGISLAAQATALGLWYMAFSDEQTTYESASKTIEEASADPEFSSEDIEKFKEVTDQYLAQKQTEQIIYLSIFGASWVASSVYAYFTSAKAIKSKRYRSRKSYYGRIESKPAQIVSLKPENDIFQVKTFSPDFRSLGLSFKMDL